MVRSLGEGPAANLADAWTLSYDGDVCRRPRRSAARHRAGPPPAPDRLGDPQRPNRRRDVMGADDGGAFEHRDRGCREPSLETLLDGGVGEQLSDEALARH